MLKRLFASNSPRPQASSATRSYGSSRTVTGKTVDPESALTVPGFLAIIRILSEDLSTLPLITYERLQPRGKQRATNHYLYPILHDAFNDEMIAQIGRELVVSHIIGWGDFYGQKIVNNAGQLMEIWPLNPARMRVERDKETSAKIYKYSDERGRPVNFIADEIWHIPGFGFNGLNGMSWIKLLKNALALAMSAEEYGGEFFENDARPGVVLKHPKKLSDTAYNHLRDTFKDEHQGEDHRWKPLIAEEGMDIATIGIPTEDALYIEGRKFQLREFARVARIPPHMVGDVDGSTSWGTGIEQQSRGYVTFTLRPWAGRIEQSAKLNLLLPFERKTYFVEHLFDDLVVGDLQARFGAYSVALQNGIYSPNEVREMENRNPYEGGDTYRTQLNTAPATASASFAPLASDAAARCLRREAHDLLDAARRFAKREDIPGMTAWLENFYSVDHVEFMSMQLEPLARGLTMARGYLLDDNALRASIRSFVGQVAAGHLAQAKSFTELAATHIKSGGLVQALDVLEHSLRAIETSQAAPLGDQFIAHFTSHLEQNQ